MEQTDFTLQTMRTSAKRKLRWKIYLEISKQYLLNIFQIQNIKYAIPTLLFSFIIMNYNSIGIHTSKQEYLSSIENRTTTAQLVFLENMILQNKN